MGNVFVKSGEQPRYFTWSGAKATPLALASAAMPKESPYSAFQAIVAGTGAVTATVLIQGTNDPTTAAGTNEYWVTLGTLTLSGTTFATDGVAVTAPWRWVRTSVTAISGAGALVQAIMGV